MTTKKYKLLQDINSPDLIAKKGDIGIVGEAVAGDLKVWFDDSRYYFWLTTVLGNPDFFEEVKEPERIKVHSVRKVNNNMKMLDPDYVFCVTQNIPEEKFPAIKKAIEDCLNGDTHVNGNNIWTIKEAVAQLGEMFYTQSELDKAIEDAFKAARKKAADPRTDIEKYYDDLSGNGDFDEY